MTKIQSFSLTDRGRTRRNNEDFVASFEPVDPNELLASGCLYIVADGVGGEAKGERASQYAAEKVLYEYYQHPDLEISERLRQAMIQVNKDIFNHAEQSEHITRMATTLVAAAVKKNTLIVANVGDSRAYLIRNRQVIQINRDHSLVGEMVARGEITEVEAQDSIIKNRLTRSLGGESQVAVAVYPPITLQTGDRILLCSDGLTRYANREKIGELTSHGSPQEITERLIWYANSRGGADNISAILITLQEIESVEKPAERFPSLPLPPSWETMETEPGHRSIQKPSLTSKGWIRWAALGAGLLCLAGAASYGILRQVLIPQIYTSKPINTIIVRPLSPQAPILPSETFQQSPPQIDTAIVVPTQTNTLESSVAESATPTFGISLATNTSVLVPCKYRIQNGDTLFNVAKKFEIAGNNYHVIICDTESASGCDLSKPANVQPGWIVIIPNVSLDVCTKNIGTVPTATP